MILTIIAGTVISSSEAKSSQNGMYGSYNKMCTVADNKGLWMTEFWHISASEYDSIQAERGI